jgi:hypothetical protein
MKETNEEENEEENEEVNIFSIPYDVFEYFILFLDYKELYNFYTTNKYFYTILKNENIWKIYHIIRYNYHIEKLCRGSWSEYNQVINNLII